MQARQDTREFNDGTSTELMLPRLPENADRGWPATAGVQRWALMAAETPLREKPNADGAITSVLRAGDEVDCLGVESAGGKKWCRLSLPGGQKGYVPGSTSIHHLVHVALEQARGEMRSSPEATASVVRQLVRGDTFLLVKTINVGSEAWVRIRCADGREGFLHGKAKIKHLGAKPQNTPDHDMIVGALWCIGGIIVTAATYSAAADHGGSYVIAWGAILFGGLQFLKGAFRNF